jgi:hypothetical protein
VWLEEHHAGPVSVVDVAAAIWSCGRPTGTTPSGLLREIRL